MVRIVDPMRSLYLPVDATTGGEIQLESDLENVSAYKPRNLRCRPTLNSIFDYGKSLIHIVFKRAAC